MLKKIYDMPAGTLGFEAVGEVDDDDVEKVLAPALRRWVAERGKVRLLYVLGVRLDEYEGDAVSENAKFLARHPTSFERVAVVSDEGWLAPAIKALSLLLPGEAKAFPVRELAAAKRWLAEGLAADGSPAPETKV
jgi:SpoIIAA-like